MNRKKIAALVLSAVLLMGGAGFGAYSWFTSSAHVSSNLTISTGSLKVEATDPNWQCMNPDTTESKVENNIVTNAQPGDDFFKVATITNNGSLSEKVHFTVNDKVADKYGLAVFVTAGEDETSEHYNKIQDKVLKPGETVNLRLVVSLSGDHMGNDFNGRELGKNINLEELIGNKNIVTVDATQVNAPATDKTPEAK